MEHKRRKSDSLQNGKVGIREVYEVVMPMKDDIADTRTDIGVINTRLGTIESDVGHLKKCIGGKISIKAFATWLSVTTGLLLIVFVILGFYYRGV